ncbi:MAG: transglutaminase protein [Bacillota bacterium]|nr:transglutaminase protein [Bacillota bacterium]
MYEDLKYLKVNLPEDILKLKCSGDFKEAIKLIDLQLQKDITNAMRKRLELEKHIICIIEKEYPYSFEEAFNILSDNVIDFKEEQLIKLKEESSADWILVDGKVKFNESFYGNLIKTKPDIRERLKVKENEELNIKKEQLLDDFIKNIKLKGNVSYYLHLKSSLKIKKQAERINETIKVHVPVPKNSEQTKNINIISSSVEPKFIAPLHYPQRTIFFEEKLKENQEFSVEYSYENHLKYNELNPNKVSEIQPTFCLEELEPHIMFTPYIKELAYEIIGDETNPLIKARKIYDYITTKIMYSYMRKYFTITNIPEYAALNLKGDCGVQALLFITLCRLVGVPAKWQSGLYVTPYYVGCHDWAQFYIEPYGWLFADPSFGGSAYRKCNEEAWNFYFGNLDPFRMVAASEFQHEFNPPKKHLRYDPYDNQTGEVEYEDKGLVREDFYVNFNLIDIHEIN